MLLLPSSSGETSRSSSSFLQSSSTSTKQQWKKNKNNSATTKKKNKNEKNKNEKKTSSSSSIVEVIEPGLVLLRSVIDDKECQRLANLANEWGQQGEDGFYSTNVKTGQKVLNTGESGRGRIYDAATRFPTNVIEHCNKCVKMARRYDNEMPDMICTHLLLNMYTTSKGLIWHRDIYENDGLSDHPVVNMCVGASCLFGFKHDDDTDDPTHRTIKLNNGDVLLFGGRCRLIKHAVLEVLLDDCPDWMKSKDTNPCRYSFTFRDSPEVLGREDEFKYFRVTDHLVGQNNFQLPDSEEDRKSFRGLPSLKSQRFSSTSTISSLKSSQSQRWSSISTFDPKDIDIGQHCGEDEEDLSETQDETEFDYDFEVNVEVNVDNVNVEVNVGNDNDYDDDDDIVSVSSC